MAGSSCLAVEPWKPPSQSALVDSAILPHYTDLLLYTRTTGQYGYITTMLVTQSVTMYIVCVLTRVWADVSHQHTVCSKAPLSFACEGE
jgi:hypothetical protein